MEVTICSYSILTNLRVHTTRLTTANCDFRILTSTRQMHNITSYLGIFENGRCDSYYRSTSKPELLACLHPSSQRRCGCCGDITAKAVGPSIYSLFSVPRMARPLPSAPSSSSATHEIRRFSDQLLGVEADEKGWGGYVVHIAVHWIVVASPLPFESRHIWFRFFFPLFSTSPLLCRHARGTLELSQGSLFFPAVRLGKLHPYCTCCEATCGPLGSRAHLFRSPADAHR
jgi:hypothetical protein